MTVILLVFYAELRTNQDEYLDKISQLQAQIQDMMIEQNNTIQANSEKITSNVQATEEKNAAPEDNYHAITEKISSLEGNYQAIANQVSALRANDHATEKKVSVLDQDTEQNISALKAKDQDTEQKISAIEAKDQETEQKISAIVEAKDQETEGKTPALKEKQPQIMNGRPSDCEELYSGGKTHDGVYIIYPDNSPMQVYCEMSQTHGSIVIQKRSDGSLAYDRSFQEYSDGFGDLRAEHWLGLSLVHRITATGHWKLRIELGSFENEARFAEYSEFKIGPAPNFQLLFDKSSYHGNAGDGGRGLSYHHILHFSTRDRDEDWWTGSCSHSFGRNSGWWFKNCLRVITTGMPYRGRYSIRWDAWEVDKVLKSATLKIKKI